MIRVLLALLLGVTFTHSGLSVSYAAEQTVLGNLLLVKDPGAPEKRKIVVKAKEKGSLDTIVGDPTVDGAQVGVRAEGASTTEQLFALPQGTSSKGKPFWTGDATKGFKYKDPKGDNGPVKQAQIKKSGGGTFTIKLVILGKLGLVSVLPPDPGDGGCAVVLLGAGDIYSIRFAQGDGKVTNKGATLFKVSKPTMEGSCLPDPTTTTTTTSTSSSSTTSTSSTSSTSTSTSTTTSTTATTIFAGPAFPPEGGSVTADVTGNAQNPGGADVSYHSFSPTTWTALYFGPWSPFFPAAGLDGSLHTLPFLGISGAGDTVATWQGTTSWTDPADSTVYTNVPIRLTLTITAPPAGLAWELSTGIPGLDPGPGNGIGAVIDIAPAGTVIDYVVKFEFMADIPTDASGFIALSTVPQLGGGQTQSSVSTGFYSQP